MMVLAIGPAALTRAAGLSIALGAFLAGMLVNESESSHEILTGILAIRDVFVAVFFASIGLLVQPLSLASQVPTILILVLLVVVGNFWIWQSIVRVAGYGAETAGLAALGLTQIGEVFVRLGGSGIQRRADRGAGPASDSRHLTRHDRGERVTLSPHAGLAEA